MFDVPVAVFVYNRPGVTEQVLDAILKIEPEHLLVVADGPVDQQDAVACEQVRALFDRVGSNCRVERNFSTTNLGCGKRVSGGLDWVFTRVERAVILEDDTVPDPTFFEFCRQLLDRFEGEESVMQIGGTNLAGSVDYAYSYGFSKFALPPWGWATWANRWNKYDFEISLWDERRDQIRDRIGASFQFWDGVITAYRKQLYSWDLQWHSALWIHNGVSVAPAYNMVSNMGWGEGATHTRTVDTVFNNMTRRSCPLPLVHPPSLNSNFDEVTEPQLFHLFADANRTWKDVFKERGT